MLEKIYINDPGNMDLNMYRCGIEDCACGHAWGPAVRDHYIVHYVLGGKGIFQMNGLTYNLGEHDGFLICPNTVVYYKADDEEPWSYAWVGFNGLKAATYLKQAGLYLENPVFRYEKDDLLKNCLMQMIETKRLAKGREIRLLGLLYEFLSRLVETSADWSHGSSSKKQEYVKKAMEFISMNYSRKTSVSEISHSVGLDRSYLYSLFNENLSISPKEFLICFRIEKACELMHRTSLSIGDISRSVGYGDPLMFSKAFKKIKGISPREFRKRL